MEFHSTFSQGRSRKKIYFPDTDGGRKAGERGCCGGRRAGGMEGGRVGGGCCRKEKKTEIEKKINKEINPFSSLITNY